MGDGMDPCRYCGSRMGCERWCPNQGDLIDTEALKTVILKMYDARACQDAEARERSMEEDALKEALAFYADPATYAAPGHPQIDADLTPINLDNGKKARTALGGQS